MKLDNLSLVGQLDTKRIVVTIPCEMFEKLKVYADEGERSGFVREGTGLLLALTDDYNAQYYSQDAYKKLEVVADSLIVGCQSKEDLNALIYHVELLRKFLKQKRNAL